MVASPRTCSLVMVKECDVFACVTARSTNSSSVAPVTSVPQSQWITQAMRPLSSRRAAQGGELRLRLQEVVDRLDGTRPFADRRRHPLHRPGADIADGEDARYR